MRWGIIGSGKIAGRFAYDLKFANRAILTGVAGRNFSNTLKFTAEYGGVPFKSVPELLASDCDVIYVATPHPQHYEHALASIRAGKAVLCEKPFTMNAHEAKVIFSEAKSKKVFVMEGMWTRFFPAISEVIDLIDAGEIGNVTRIESSFGYQSQFDPNSRIFHPELGGGSLLDVGVYCVALSQMIMKVKPSVIKANAFMAPTGVDETSSWELGFPSGVVVRGRSSVVEALSNEAIISGEKGEIRIPQFWCPKEYSLNGIKKEFSFEGRGFQFEAMEVTNCFEAGQLESKLVSHQFTLDVMETLDTIREMIGLFYPSRSQT